MYFRVWGIEFSNDEYNNTSIPCVLSTVWLIIGSVSSPLEIEWLFVTASAEECHAHPPWSFEMFAPEKAERVHGKDVCMSFG